MSVGDGSEPVSDDEVVYRRVSEKSGHYDPSSDRPVAWEAFRPNRHDRRGLSVWRAQYLTPEEAAAINAKAGTRYWILALRVKGIRDAGVVVEASGEEGGRGHASLANMSTGAYAENKNAVRELSERIASEMIDSVEGPFGPFG